MIDLLAFAAKPQIGNDWTRSDRFTVTIAKISGEAQVTRFRAFYAPPAPMELLLTVVAVSGLSVHKVLDGSKTVVIGRLPQSDGWLRTQALKHERDLQYGCSFGLAVWTLADSLELHGTPACCCCLTSAQL